MSNQSDRDSVASHCYAVSADNREVFLEPSNLRHLAERLHVVFDLFGFEYGLPEMECYGEKIFGNAHTPSIDEIEAALRRAIEAVKNGSDHYSCGRFATYKVSEGHYAVSFQLGWTKSA